MKRDNEDVVILNDPPYAGNQSATRPVEQEDIAADMSK
jgi:hypothetical protein